ncbi:MAG: Ni/Fe hydrogenase subunit alpha [Gammaproteobacteria bacterium]|nr:Ni/Fe hydrogenase subunit alpha [Gammaproteobacteria bacterium]
MPVLTRVEGEGALDISIKQNKIESLQLRIFEPPRLFEKLLEGRLYTEIPDIVSRICGICPVAYQMSAVHAFEGLFGVDPGSWVRDMRRVFYCGEWLESHSLHIHLLAAPDFLGFDSAPAMAKEYPQELRRGLKLQALGNDLIRLFGARSVNPVGAKVGGFTRAPSIEEINALLDKLRAALPDAEALISWTALLKFPKIVQHFPSVSISHPGEYPMNEGDLESNQGLHIPINQFEHHFEEKQVAYSTALHCTLSGQAYLVGPLARINLNYGKLHSEVKQVVEKNKLQFPSQNVYHSIVARAAEIYYALIEAIRLLENYHVPRSPFVDVVPKKGIAYGCTEAPRGSLWHQYELNKNGVVQKARIVPPTSQNQARIEEDLRFTLEEFGLDAPEETLRLQAERVIRNYDPCISCATHFLNLTVTRQ